MTINGHSVPNGTYQEGYNLWDEPLGTQRPVRMIVIGAGASGLCAAYKFKKHLKQCEFVIYEVNEDIGGTWYGVSPHSNYINKFAYHYRIPYSNYFIVCRFENRYIFNT